MRVAICDDENIFLEQLESKLKAYSEIEQIDQYTDVTELEQYLSENPAYDIIFMDIEWKQADENGTDYAARINERYTNVQIIFVTAYNERFSQAIFFKETNLCGYLVKPIEDDKLRILMEKAMQNIAKQQSEVLLVQYKGAVEMVPVSNILYMESRAHQLFISTINDRILTYKKIDDYEQMLEHLFVRIHKSFFVNMDYIKRFERTVLTLKNGETLPVSKAKYLTMRNKFFKYMGEQL